LRVHRDLHPVDAGSHPLDACAANASAGAPDLLTELRHVPDEVLDFLAEADHVPAGVPAPLGKPVHVRADRLNLAFGVRRILPFRNLARCEK